jgi:3-oxoadipate enol-lactonase/4-carboxymuconolactone decarboxylase
MRSSSSIDPSLRDTRAYRAHDGTELAYWVRGTGSPLVLTNGLTTTTSFWTHLLPRWERAHRVLTWDLPGHGASSPARSQGSASIAEQPELVARLMDEAGIERAVQIGWSTGCQVVLEMYRRYPERCSGLVLLLGSAGRVLSTAKLPLPGPAIEWIVRRTPHVLFGAATRALAHAAHAPFGQLAPRAFGLIGQRTTQQDAALITDHLRRIDTRTVQTMIASAQAHSAWDVLPSIAVPVLIAAGDLDPFAPAGTVGVAMHAQCRNSELLRLPQGTHTALFDHADEIAKAVDAFFVTSRLDASAC